MTNFFAGSLIGLGVTLMLLAGIGIHKFQDFFYKIHVASKGPSLGVMLILVGVAFYFGTWLTTLKCLAIAFFVFITVPVSSSVLALARYELIYGELKEGEGEESITKPPRVKAPRVQD